MAAVLAKESLRAVMMNPFEVVSLNKIFMTLLIHAIVLAQMDVQ
jgi:hypothetical protein